MSRVDIRGKLFCLTFSQCNAHDKDDVVEHLSSFAIDGYIVAQERHADGGRHFHCLVSFKKQIRITKQSYFDMPFQVVNWSKPLDGTGFDYYCYCLKEDDSFVTFGTLDEPPKEVVSKKRPWDEINEAKSVDELLSLVRVKDPRSFWLYRDRLESNAREVFKERPEPYAPVPGRTFVLDQSIVHWLETEFVKTDRPRTLVLVGPSRIGKTEWARSLGRHMYFNSQFNMDDWDETASYIILDDLDLTYIPTLRKPLLFGQRNFTITDKYRKKKSVTFGKPCIVLCNREPEWSSLGNEPWHDNIVVVYVEKMY